MKNMDIYNGTIDFLPMMVERKNSGENIVRERHGLRRSL